MTAGLRDPETGDPTTGAADAAAPDIAAHLARMEAELVDRSIAFAKSNGYAPYTTTIRAAWVEAIRSLTEALAGYLAEDRRGPVGPLAGVAYRDDPRFSRMRAIARTHRSLGITLELYLGLFKHFRRVYLAALAGVPWASGQGAGLAAQVQDFFDETELSVTADWTASSDEHRLRELQARTRALTLAKDRYVAIFESLRHPALLLDRERRLVHANQAAVELFLGDSEAGDGLYRHGRDALTAHLQAELATILDHERDSGPEIRLDTAAGARWFDRRLRPLHDAVENIPLGYLLQLYDVTAYHDATEQARLGERQMSRFLATMSHEIRTPLHSVLGAADLLRMAESDARETYLDVIQSAGQSLLKTLNNVLDYSKLENGPPVPRPVDTDIGPALRTFCAMASVGPQAARTQLVLDLSDAVPPHVRIDWAMTRQVLTNLVSNALRHDDGSGVSLRVDASHEDAGRRLCFSVTDHGPGLPPDAKENFHRPFEAVEARHTVEGGAGLGLAISRHLAAAMDGAIGFENSGTGARVWLEIPYDLAEPAAARAEAPVDAGCGGRCLLVDDDPVGSIVSVRQLERIGFAVDRAATIGAARAALDGARYDAVVVDFLLPDGTGPELLAALPSDALDGRPRVVALTANVEVLDACGPPGRGFDQVLAKPADAASLARALRGGPVPCAVQGAAPPVCPGLQGLSTSTIAAMVAAFLQQWAAFREKLRTVRRGGEVADLGECAHRLAGTTAQLGLADLAAPLREMERRCDAGAGDLGDLIDRLDRPAEETPGWRHLPRVPAAT